MAKLAKTLEIRTSPHIVSGESVERIMLDVLLALAPATLFAVYAFGLAALALAGTAIAAALVAERLTAGRDGAGSSLADGSAAVTGLLFALTLPPGLPLWMCAVGAVASIVLGKTLFGGLGSNPFNPALVGRALLQGTFPVSMTTWLAPFGAERFSSLPGSLLALPFTRPVYDGVTGATPLAAWKFSQQPTGTRDLALGFVSGSLGETSALLIVLGGAYLIARNRMSWRTPLAICGTVAVVAALLHAYAPERYASPELMLLSGGLALGALFMATDPVTSPLAAGGLWIHGVFVGILVVVIRTWAGLPEGVMYAILLGNAVTPLIDRTVRPRVYGTRRGRGK